MKFDPEVNPILEHIQGNPESAQTREYAFLHAVDFYNRKKYFEAHEIFEFQWKKETGDRKIYIQALIQISVAMNKFFVNINIKGALSQANLALEKLSLLQRNQIFHADKVHYLNSIIQNLEKFIDLLVKEETADYSNYSPPLLAAESYDFLS